MARSRSRAASARSSSCPSCRARRRGARPRRGSRKPKGWPRRSASSSPPTRAVPRAHGPARDPARQGPGRGDRRRWREEQDAGLLIVDAPLTPIQQKNLEDEVGTKVIDRTGLILEIFGERAATAEGRLQVELAHLDYQAGRLVRSWTHLERQRGGFGFLGGPGETQIEADRPHDPRPHGEDPARARPGQAHPLAASRPAPARAVAGDCAGRLYQRRKVDAFQSPDGRSCVRREPAVRDARPDHARHPAAGLRQGRSCRTRSDSSPTCRPS